MIISLVLGALACLWAWELLRTLVTLPVALAPFAVFGIAYGVLALPAHYLLVMAVAGGMAVVRKIASPGPVRPLPWRDIREIVRPPKRYGRVHPGAMGKAPASMIGRRVPKL